METGLFILGRILFGGFFLMMGIRHFMNVKSMSAYAASKGVPSPQIAVLLTGIMMLLGGLGIIFQIEPQWSARLIAIFLLGTTPKMHQFWKETDPAKKMGEQTNFVKNMALLGASLIIGF